VSDFDIASSTIEVVTSLQLAVAERAHHAPVVPCELPAGILLVYADDRGRQHTVDLHDANLVDFGLAKPLRKPPAYRGQRNFPGWWWSATTRSHVLYESWLERHYIIEADRAARVTGISGQPFALTWPSGRKRDAAHFPDLFCRSVGGGGIVTDCRPVERSDDEFRYKCAVTAAACQVAGWEFRLSGEPDPVWAVNLRWIAGYRHPRFADPGVEDLLVSAFTQPGALAETVRQVGDPIRVLPVLFHLLWRGRLTGDLSRPLGYGTLLTATADPLGET
jgi:hypothetical protein